MSTLALPGLNVLDRFDPTQQVIMGYLSKCKSSNTLRAYQEDLKNWFAWCEQHQVIPLEVKRVHLDMYVRWMQHQERWSESTISRRIGTVCGLYKYAADEDYIAKNPGSAVTRPGVDREKQHRTYLNPVQYAQLVAEARRSTLQKHVLIVLLGMMGLRISEALSLNVESVSERGGYTIVSFVGKGNKAAHAPVPVPVMRPLEELVRVRQTGPLLLHPDGDRRLTRPWAGRFIRDLCEQAGLPNDITPHSLRRTFATVALLHKVPLYEVQIAMRHSNPNTTALYDMAKHSMDRNATHQIAGLMASMAS